LSDTGGEHDWPANPSPCDEFAAAPYDPDRRSPGVASGELIADLAIAACAESAGQPLRNAQFIYQRGRALIAHGEFVAGRNALEQAVAAGYRASNIDLGRLLLDPQAAMLDPRRAISLYEFAWQKGVTIASYELGTLFEHGLANDGKDTLHHFAPDVSQAWVWYRKGADSGEPDALARFAEREERAALQATDPANSRAHLLDGFSYYAAAAERARQEGWPDDEWAGWRHRRASLARLLAHDGNMQEVANAFTRVYRQYNPDTH
jgi:TPR repeat protein